MATNLPSCFSIEFLEQLLKFLVNFTLLKYVKSQRNYGFLITKKADFWLPNFEFKRSLLSLLKLKNNFPLSSSYRNLVSKLDSLFSLVFVQILYRAISEVMMCFSLWLFRASHIPSPYKLLMSNRRDNVCRQNDVLPEKQEIPYNKNLHWYFSNSESCQHHWSKLIRTNKHYQFQRIAINISYEPHFR